VIAGFLPCHLRMEYEAALHRLVAGFVPFALRLFCSLSRQRGVRLAAPVAESLLLLIGAILFPSRGLAWYLAAWDWYAMVPAITWGASLEVMLW